MRNIDMNLRQAWLIDYIQHHPGKTRQEILEAWTFTSVSEFGKITYNKTALWDDIFDIRRGYALHIYTKQVVAGKVWGYFIKDDFNAKHYRLQRWMLDVLQTGLLENTYRDLCNFVLLEAYPCINGILQPVLHAIRDGKKLRTKYHRYGKDAQGRTFAPYCVKAYKHRFYVLGRYNNGNFNTFAFDRIDDLEITDTEYQMPPDFDAAEYFKHFYGVYTNIEGLEVTRIGIRAHDDAQHYLRDVPFHATQQEIYSCDDYADFEIEIYPTRDFIGDILQQCDRLEVLYPLSVRKMVAEAYHAGSLRYADCPLT